jgi:O-antigen ligase
MLAFLAGLAVLAAVLWVSSPYLRERVTNIPQEITSFSARTHDTSAGSRIAFWQNSVAIMREAPLIGEGTGAITAAFARRAGAASSATNPHNQILTVGVQLGLVGIAVLIAMWAAHVWLFSVRDSPGDGGADPRPNGPAGRIDSIKQIADLAGWVGLAVVVENIVASLFNSQLFDFTTGWIYVFGVGAAGGMVLSGRGRGRVGTAPAR